jgi:hypothetical protein
MYNNHKPSILNPSPPTSTHASPSQPIHSESYYPRMTPFTELPHPHQEKPHGLFQAKFMKSDTHDPISPSPTPSPPIVCQSKVLEPYRHESTSDSYYQRRAMDYYS